MATSLDLVIKGSELISQSIATWISEENNVFGSSGASGKNVK